MRQEAKVFAMAVDMVALVEEVMAIILAITIAAVLDRHNGRRKFITIIFGITLIYRKAITVRKSLRGWRIYRKAKGYIMSVKISDIMMLKRKPSRKVIRKTPIWQLQQKRKK